jgi:tetratricopeptide (TPR) repeat protein
LLGDFADADKWFSKVTVEAPNDPEAWYLLGRTKYNENRFTEAAASFEHVLALRPKDVQAEDNLGLSQQGLGHMDQAKTAYQTAIGWQGDAPRTRNRFSISEFCSSIKVSLRLQSNNSQRPQLSQPGIPGSTRNWAARFRPGEISRQPRRSLKSQSVWRRMQPHCTSSWGRSSAIAV